MDVLHSTFSSCKRQMAAETLLLKAQASPALLLHGDVAKRRQLAMQRKQTNQKKNTRLI
jgi:hypothetical protein